MDKRVEYAVATSGEQSTVNVRIPLLYAMYDVQGWVLLISDTYQHFKLKQRKYCKTFEQL